MASRVYCSSVADELIGWSEKLRKLSEEIDRIPSIDKYRMLPQIEELHIIMTEMEDRLCDLVDSCSTVETGKSGESGAGPEFEAASGTERFDYEFGG